MNIVSLFHGFVNNKKVNLGIIEEEISKDKKQNIQNNNDVKITSKKNINEISDDSMYIPKFENFQKNYYNTKSFKRIKRLMI